MRLPRHVPISIEHDNPMEKKSTVTVSPSLTLICTSCHENNWMFHVFREQNDRPRIVRRCRGPPETGFCGNNKGRWVTPDELEEIYDQAQKEEEDWRAKNGWEVY